VKVLKVLPSNEKFPFICIRIALSALSGGRVGSGNGSRKRV
jgi:hypothetical protein